ncbi:MAG: SDR family NAD(P)-dependent oxidoreductase [Acidimicrobiales bacterium]|jgi:NAD(P)-dependent dehydrogenase (short-subunit alcohol dehydrogenase family)
MARILITGSSDGLGLMAAQLLARQHHEVVLHARNERRALDARMALPEASAVVVGDIATIAGMRQVAEAANATGRFDAVIHNAAVGSSEPRRIVTADGLSHVFAINVLAPYVLTAQVEMPSRLIYLSSGMHRGGSPSMDDLQWSHRRWDGSQAYSDSKLFVAVLAAAVARHRPDVRSNAVDPGWVATKMGGAGAPDDLALGSVTQAWLAVGDDAGALVSGAFFYHQRPCGTHPSVHDHRFQEDLLASCADIGGVTLPGTSQGD